MSFDQKGFYQLVGQLLKKHRLEAGRTQEDVADELNITRASYASIESGRQRAPADVVWRLAIEFGVPVTRLLPEPLKRVREDMALKDGSAHTPLGRVRERDPNDGSAQAPSWVVTQSGASRSGSPA